MRGSGPGTPSGSRYEGSAVLGRLAGLRTVQSSGGSGHGSASHSRYPTGPESEYREELFGPHSVYNLHRVRVKRTDHEGLPIPSTRGRHPSPALSLSQRQIVAPRHVSASLGQTDIGISCCSAGLTVAAPSAEMAEQLPPGRKATQTPTDQGVMSVPPCPSSVEGRVLSVQGGPYGFYSLSAGGGCHRCLPNRMGCGVERQNSSGSVARSRTCQTYQCARTASSISGIEAFSAIPGRTTCAHTVGQHLDSVSHKSPRRHQVCAATTGIAGAPDMGSPPTGQPAGSIFTWGAKPTGRLPVASQASTWGVAPSSRGGAHHLGPLRQGGCGCLRLRSNDPLSPLVFSDGDNQPPWPGCTGSPLAEDPLICISSTPSDPANTSEGPSGWSQAATGGSFLASEDMVSSHSQAVPRYTLAPPLQDRPAVSIGGPDLASQSSEPPALGLATGGPESLLSSCPEPVRQTILNARAPSTRLQYDNRWKLFCSWCAGREVDPAQCPIPMVLEFLQSLLDRGRSPSTLKVYVAAISCHHARVDNGTVGSHSLVSLFLKGAWRLRPPKSPRVPAWDLTLVLQALCRFPFEPLAQAELKWVAYKTAFLLAITSAKRVGELHALSVSSSCLRWNHDKSSVTLWPNPAFLPKVLCRSYLNQPIRLTQFNPPAGEAGDEPELLCPVRALRTYVAATAGVRLSEQLFVCYSGPNKGSALSKQRLSHWVVDVLIHAHVLANRPLPPGVRCHSTRSISTSWAALRGVPLETICAAASWSSPSTFCRFYRVNVAAPTALGVVLRPESSGSVH